MAASVQSSRANQSPNCFRSSPSLLKASFKRWDATHIPARTSKAESSLPGIHQQFFAPARSFFFTALRYAR